MLEFQQFNIVWDKKMQQYEDHADELVEAMQERHQGELREFQRKLLGKQQKPKFSRELLNLRKIQEHLAKQKDYTEAHKMKLKSDALEAWELEKWRNLKQQEMFQKEAKFKHRQQQELLALQKRIQTGREEQKKQRQMDLERLLQRYQNVKSELEAQQTAERHRQKKGAAGQGLLQSGLGSSASVARRSSAGAIPRRPASAARGATPASRAPGFSAARTPAPPKWR